MSATRSILPCIRPTTVSPLSTSQLTVSCRNLFHLTVKRHASTQPPSSKPHTLEQPSKFNPPSHPQRLVRQPPRTYGPSLTEPQLQAQKTKKYPHMMPSEGSFMHWFLTNRAIHVWISLGTLIFLGLFTTITNFRTTSPYASLLPPASSLFVHPITFTRQYVEVFKLQVLQTSEETAERRRKKVDDVEKRTIYRRKHGLDQEPGLGGWISRTFEGEAEAEAAANKKEGKGGSEGEGRLGEDGSPVAVMGGGEEGEEQVQGRRGKEEEEYVDFEGRKRPVVKKWFGIWS